MPLTADGAREAAVVAKGRTTCTLGPAPDAAAEEAPTAAEMGPVAEEVGPVAELGPEVEVSAGGVGPWRTYGRKEWAPLVFAIVGPEGEQT